MDFVVFCGDCMHALSMLKIDLKMLKSCVQSTQNRMKTYHKTSKGRNSNCSKLSQVCISNQSTNERNNIRDSHPSIHNICSKNLIHVIHFHQIDYKVCLHSKCCQPLTSVISCPFFSNVNQSFLLTIIDRDGKMDGLDR